MASIEKLLRHNLYIFQMCICTRIIELFTKFEVSVSETVELGDSINDDDRKDIS